MRPKGSSALTCKAERRVKKAKGSMGGGVFSVAIVLVPTCDSSWPNSLIGMMKQPSPNRKLGPCMLSPLLGTYVGAIRIGVCADLGIMQLSSLCKKYQTCESELEIPW